MTKKIKKEKVEEINMPTPLLLTKVENKNVVFMKVDYVKALLDYKVEYSLPEMSRIEMTKMINFFIHNDVVKSNRPPELNIKDMTSANVDGEYINFTIYLSKDLEDDVETANFYKLFCPYFDLWMQKFVIIYGKYMAASNAGMLDQLLKS